MSSRWTALSVLGAACFAGCAEPAAESGTASLVDTAYAALASDVSACAEQRKACLSAAADDAAVDVCREDFSACRQEAGQAHVKALADATRSCSTTHKECVRTAEKGDAASCQDALQACLGARPKQSDDEDAGPDNDESKAARADCRDELHTCVKADGPANLCAEKVRSCLGENTEDETADAGPGKDRGKGKAEARGKSNKDAGVSP